MMFGSRLPNLESASIGFISRARASGGRAAKKHMTVKRRYRAMLMNMVHTTEGFEILKSAPVWNAPEKVVLYATRQVSLTSGRHDARGECLPDEQNETAGRQLGQLQQLQRPDNLGLPRPPQGLPDDERQDDAEAELLGDVGVHAAEGGGPGGPPGPKGGVGVGGHEAVDEQRGEKGAKDVAEDDGDDGGGLVAAGAARHDHIGGNGGGQAGGGEQADEDGDGRGAGVEGACRDANMKDCYKNMSIPFFFLLGKDS